MVLALAVALAGGAGVSSKDIFPRGWDIQFVLCFLALSLCYFIKKKQKIIVYIYLCLMLQCNMQRRGVFLRPFCAGSGHGGIIHP